MPAQYYALSAHRGKANDGGAAVLVAPSGVNSLTPLGGVKSPTTKKAVPWRTAF
ncbi:MAG: hypothetical protein ACI81V_001397 [Lentimonas sp.]|jgi:hypothetical protein